MRPRRYTVVFADRSSGVVRRLTISLRPLLAGTAAVLAMPVLIGLGAKWSARAEIDQLRAANSMLQVENGSYRAATGELTTHQVCPGRMTKSSLGLALPRVIRCSQ